MDPISPKTPKELERIKEALKLAGQEIQSRIMKLSSLPTASENLGKSDTTPQDGTQAAPATASVSTPSSEAPKPAGQTAVFLRDGNSFRPTDKVNLDVHYQLPPGNYVIKVDPMSNQLYFHQVEDFALPEVMYGDIHKRADRILNTFAERKNSTGVLLTGDKGSGKSLLAKLVSSEGAKRRGLPTILVNAPFTGDSFNRLIQCLPEAIIVFDEYEKTYDDPKAKAMALTLLDGLFQSKKLFVFTSNDKYALDQHLHNRPGRIYYCYDYSGLDEEFIRDYCGRNLVDPTGKKLNDILQVMTLFRSFNFDMLQALVEELNRYGESVRDVLQVMNIRPTTREVVFDFSVVNPSGVLVPPTHYDSKTLREFPLSLPSFHNNIRVVYKDEDGDDYDNWETVNWDTRENLVKADYQKGTYTFRNEEGWVATLTRSAGHSYDSFSFLA